jgi:DNA repair protein RadC
MKKREAGIASHGRQGSEAPVARADATAGVRHVTDAIEFGPEQEQVWVVLLNSRRVPVGCECCFCETVDELPFHPRRLLRTLMLSEAQGFVVVHKRSRRSPAPGRADMAMAAMLRDAALLVGVPLVGHIVVETA